MTRINLLVSICFFLVASQGCSFEEADAFIENSSPEQIWVFAQFNVQEKNGLEDYYYYGRVSKSLFEKISRNTIRSGFILLGDIRYIGNDDIIHEYRDSESSGDILFRIEDIRRFERIVKPPAIGKSFKTTTPEPPPENAPEHQTETPEQQ